MLGSISALIVVLYQISYGYSEWYPGAGRHFTILYNLAIASIGSILFYIIQAYIPQERKNKAIRPFVLIEYKKIIDAIDLLFEDLSELYSDGRKGALSCAEDDIINIANKLKNTDNVSTEKPFEGKMTVCEQMDRCKSIVYDATTTIMSNYSGSLSENEIKLLSKLRYGKMNDFWNGINWLYLITGLTGDPESLKFEAFLEYQKIVYTLKKIVVCEIPDV